ncbi:MAG: ferredoxin [Chitinivibrionales bacterium]|nr:ferredoxin [Chitinivibrionales bacterium]
MIKVKKNVCDVCGTCIRICPEDALLIIGELSCDETRCTSCGRCVKICPLGALSCEKPE